MKAQQIWGAFLAIAVAVAGTGGIRADIVFGSTSGNSVVAVDTTNGNVSTPAGLTGLNAPAGVAINPIDGNLYVAVQTVPGNSQVFQIEKFVRSGTGVGTFTDAGPYITGINNFFSGPGLIFDAAGNAFVTTGSGASPAAVTEYKAGGGTATISLSGANSLAYQVGLGKNGQGHATIYATDTGDANVQSADLSVATPTFSVFENNITFVKGVTADATGNVYASTSNGSLFKYSSAGGSAIDSTTISGLALIFNSNDGNVYMANSPDIFEVSSSSMLSTIHSLTPTNDLPAGVQFITVGPTLASVPEPSSLLLLGLGGPLVGSIIYRRRKAS